MGQITISGIVEIRRQFHLGASEPDAARLTPAKRRQIEAAESYRATHCGCTLHNACIRSFVPARGGYRSAKAMYEHLRQQLSDT